MQFPQSFVHVSTAYANCPQRVIEEKFYDPPMDSDKLIALMECVEDKLAEDITPQYVDFSLFEFSALVWKENMRKEKLIPYRLQIIRKMAEHLYLYESSR